MTRLWICLLILISGCAQRTASKGTIAVSVLTLTNPFFKVIADKITEEAHKNGFDVIVVSGEFDVAKQKDQVEDFVVKGVDAIVLCPCDTHAIGAAIRRANAAGIPVFTADLAYQGTEAQVVCHVATDNKLGGRQAAEAMIEALPRGGKVLVLDYKQAESCLLRVEGFNERLKEHNRDASIPIQVAMYLDGGGQKDKSFNSTEDALQTLPDMAGIFAINDPSALGARAALERAGKAERIKIIGFDGQPEGKQAIKEGRIYADPVQYPDKIGVKTMQAILRYLDGEELPKQELIPPALYRRKDGLEDPELR